MIKDYLDVFPSLQARSYEKWCAFLYHAGHGYLYFLFIDQVESDNDYQNKLISFCSNLSTMNRDFLRDLRKYDRLNYCQEIFEDIRASANPELEVTRLAGNAPKLKIFASKEASYSYSLIKLEELYRTFDRQVPTPLTRERAYDSNDTDWLKMLTSTTAHGDTSDNASTDRKRDEH